MRAIRGRPSVALAAAALAAGFALGGCANGAPTSGGSTATPPAPTTGQPTSPAQPAPTPSPSGSSSPSPVGPPRPAPPTSSAPPTGTTTLVGDLTVGPEPSCLALRTSNGTYELLGKPAEALVPRHVGTDLGRYQVNGFVPPPALSHCMIGTRFMVTSLHRVG